MSTKPAKYVGVPPSKGGEFHVGLLGLRTNVDIPEEFSKNRSQAEKWLRDEYPGHEFYVAGWWLKEEARHQTPRPPPVPVFELTCGGLVMGTEGRA